MTVFNLVLVFGVFTSAAIASEDIKELTKEIKQVKTNTGVLNLRNEGLTKLIEDGQNMFIRGMSKLHANQSSKNMELNRTMTTLTEVRVRLTRLSVEKRLLERFIPYEENILKAVENGLKWLVEYAVTLAKREESNDSTACLSILHNLVNDVHSLHLNHDEDEEEETAVVQARSAKWIEESGQDRKEDDVKVLKLELRQAKTALREAERINMQLHKKLHLDRTYQNETMQGYIKTIKEIGENVQEAEETLKSFVGELEKLSEEIEKLTKTHEELAKAHVRARDSAGKIYDLIGTKLNAIKCYDTFEEISIQGFNVNITHRYEST